MSTRTTAGWIVVVLAAVFVVVWRRRQRWRRARPWLAKLRAEAASKIEHRVEKDIREKEIIPKEIIREKTPRPKESSDKKEVKRTKERRKRGKETKPRTQPVQSSNIAPSPRLVPLPLSPVMTPLDIPSLVLPPTETPKPKLPAFPPASPLPPNLARKPPPLVRKATPSLTSINTAINTPANNSKPTRDDIDFPTLDPPKAKRKPSDAGRKRKPSTGPTPESTQIASLKGALEAARLREEEVAEERRAWQKKERELQTQVNQLSHQLHALTIAFATSGGQGFPPYGYGYDPSQPVTPIMQVPGKPEEPHTPIDHIASVRTPSGPYPGMYLPYPHHFPPYMPPQHGPPLTPQHGPPITHPIPMPSPTPPMSPPQAPPYLFSTHPWMHRNASPMRGMSSPGGIPITSPITGIGRHHFYSGSPRRGPRRHGTGTPSTPSVGSVDDTIPLPFTDGFTSRKSSSDDWARDEQPTRDDYVSREYVPPRDDYLPLREDYVPVPPPSSGTKREREETDDDDEDSTSDSDDDSVIFEDGSVGESVHLSLRGDSVKAKEVGVVRIQVGEQEVM